MSNLYEYFPDCKILLSHNLSICLSVLGWLYFNFTIPLSDWKCPGLVMYNTYSSASTFESFSSL